MVRSRVRAEGEAAAGRRPAGHVAFLICALLSLTLAPRRRPTPAGDLPRSRPARRLRAHRPMGTQH